MKKLLSSIYQGYVFSLLRKGKEDILLNKLKKGNRNFFTPKVYEIFGNLLIKNNEFYFAETILKEGIQKFKNGKGIYRTLSQLYLRRGETQKAIDVIKEAKENNKEVYWYNLVLGDLYYYEKKDLNLALKEYEELLNRNDVPLNEDIKSPARYLFKRLSRIYFEKKDYDKALIYYKKFYDLKPSNFYEKDFLYFGEVLYNLGKRDDAIKIWKEGIQRRRGNIIKSGVKKYGIDLGEVEKIEFKEGAIRIPVKTSLITERTDFFKEIEEKTKDILKNGDIITIASSVAAIADGRVFSVETIKPSIFAILLSKFVSRNKNNPFATTAPLSNPYAMQIAIEEAGLIKILFAAFLGFLGKIFGKRGIFYIIAGKIVTQIDDMPASMPPYDYYVISGVHNSKEFLEKIKKITGCEACIVDANDLGIAWVVDSTENVDKKFVEKVLSDNPQGNEDFQTPIVIIRKNTL
ncbi:MAG: coenzyme F420-0:L-glutamate ligase [Caldisericia bacterium]|nr:coenzyme F420-0:L-glutamate ligase [Caldisericia bacterium]